MPDDFASAEVATFWRYIASSVDRLIALLDGLVPGELDWRPPALNTNSLCALAAHVLGNVEENICGTLCGQHVDRDRDAEFRACAETSTDVMARWKSLRPRLEEALCALSASALDAPRRHPRRGDLLGRDILIIVARHCAEHLGQAELTRDLMRAAMSTNVDPRGP